MSIIVRAVPRSFDPFHAPSQAWRRKCACQIIVNGFDVTNRLEPFLISVTVRLRDTEIDDQAVIELDDRDARLPIPPLESDAEVALGWHTEGLLRVFTGSIKEVQSTFGRKQGGRRLHVECSGADWSGRGKEPDQRSWGEGEPPQGEQSSPAPSAGASAGKIPFNQVFSEAAQAAGLTGRVGGDLASIGRDYWMQMNESFFHFGQRMAKELGGRFHVSRQQATIVPRGKDIDGNDMAHLKAIWGDNLISWQIKPFAARSQWSDIGAQFFDIAKGIWDSSQKGVEGGSEAPWSTAIAKRLLPAAAPNAQVASQMQDGSAQNEEADRGNGHVVINGEPIAQPGCSCLVSGARPGVDGSYHVTEVDHIYSREGFTTRLQFDRPTDINTGTPAPWPGDETPTPPGGG